MSDLWDVGLLIPFFKFRTNGTFFKVSDLWDVGLMGIARIVYFKIEFSFVGLMGCRTYGVSDLWGVGLMGRRTYGGEPITPITAYFSYR